MRLSVVDAGSNTVRYPQRLEAGLFGHTRLLDEFRRTVLLTRQEISEAGHRAY